MPANTKTKHWIVEKDTMNTFSEDYQLTESLNIQIKSNQILKIRFADYAWVPKPLLAKYF